MSETNISMFIKLRNGEDLISEIIVQGQDEHIDYLLVNPLKIMYVQSNRPQHMGIALVPWVFPGLVEKQEFTLKTDEIIIIEQTSAAMNEYYWETIDSYQSKANTSLPPATEPEVTDEDITNAFMDQVMGVVSGKKPTYH